MFQEYITKKPLEKLHLELTSKCALKCLRCDRTENKGMYKITSLDIDLIKNRLKDTLKNLIFLDLSGNYGDPIYHKDFLDILRYIKSQNCREVYIETNGSGKDAEFWKTTVSILGSKDVITFSIDGLEDTNSIYRINSKWDSIYQAMKIVSNSKVHAHWKFIVFKHNQHQIEKAQQLSKQLGISQFIIVKSSLFGFKEYLNKEGIDPLQPEKKWISPHSLPSNQIAKIKPKCLSKEMHYISAEGYYFPCCWIGHYPKPVKEMFSQKDLQSLSLYNYSLKEILQSSTLKKLERSWKSINQAPQTCIKKCGDRQKNKSRSSHEKIWINL